MEDTYISQMMTSFLKKKEFKKEKVLMLLKIKVEKSGRCTSGRPPFYTHYYISEAAVAISLSTRALISAKRSLFCLMSK